MTHTHTPQISHFTHQCMPGLQTNTFIMRSSVSKKWLSLSRSLKLHKQNSNKSSLTWMKSFSFPSFYFCLSLFFNRKCRHTVHHVTCNTPTHCHCFFPLCLCLIHNYTRYTTTILHTSVQGHYTKWDKNVFMVTKIFEAELTHNMQTNTHVFIFLVATNALQFIIYVANLFIIYVFHWRYALRLTMPERHASNSNGAIESQSII